MKMLFIYILTSNKKRPVQKLDNWDKKNKQISPPWQCDVFRMWHLQYCSPSVITKFGKWLCSHQCAYEHLYNVHGSTCVLCCLPWPMVESTITYREHCCVASVVRASVLFQYCWWFDMYVCVCVRVFACVRVCMCMCAHVCVCVHVCGVRSLY
jgi:hypothetical protein